LISPVPGSFLAGGSAIKKGSFDVRSIDIAPTVAYLLDVPMPQQAQGRVLLTSCAKGARSSQSRSSA